MPEDGVIIPIDKNGVIVTDDDTEITGVIIPYWYWNLIIDYIKETETAVAALAAGHPP